MKYISTLRLLFQLFFIEFILYHAIMFLNGASYKNCESFCPMGAVETLSLFIKNGKFPCAVNELNYSIFFVIIVLTILFKRVFCSWVCPFGAINEFISSARSYFSAYDKFTGTVMKFLHSVRYFILTAIIYFTYTNYDLVFRPYCPYFTAFGTHGHTTYFFSYFVLINVLIATLIVKLGFCRILCPFGAFLALFNFKTVLKIYRDSDKCVNCGICDKSCNFEIKVSEKEVVNSPECVMCMNCISKCPKAGALKIGF